MKSLNIFSSSASLTLSDLKAAWHPTSHHAQQTVWDVNRGSLISVQQARLLPRWWLKTFYIQWKWKGTAVKLNFAALFFFVSLLISNLTWCVLKQHIWIWMRVIFEICDQREDFQWVIIKILVLCDDLKWSSWVTLFLWLSSSCIYLLYVKEQHFAKHLFLCCEERQ